MKGNLVVKFCVFNLFNVFFFDCED